MSASHDGDTLYVVSVKTGSTIDTVTLENGKLKYDSGRAQGMFEGIRRRDRNLTDEALFRFRDGWSNGYIVATRNKPDGKPLVDIDAMLKRAAERKAQWEARKKADPSGADQPP